MTGLLDFNDPQVRLGMGLLALGQAPRSQFAQGLTGLLGSLDQTAQAKAEAEWKQAQIARQKQEWAREDQERASAAALRSAIPGLFGTVTQGSVSTPQVGGTPFFSQGVNVEQPSMRTGRFNVQEALRLGMSPKQIQEFAALDDLGRQEVARTVEGTDRDGRPATLQYDKFGQLVGDPVRQWKAPVSVNQGDRTTFLDQVTLKPQASFGVNMSPAERDASARGWAGNALARERFDLEKQQAGNGYTFNAELGGYVPKNPGGQFVPLAGMSTSPKLTESEAKNSLYLSQMREASAVLGGPGAKGAGPLGVAMTGTPYLNWAASNADQTAGQAQRQWAEAYLRAKTGAAATAGEVENNIRTYFPVAGDSKATIERKAQARAAAESDMAIPAGRGAARVGNGGASGSWDGPQKAPNIPQAAINDLKMRGPGAKAQFDEVFGQGAADRVLGGR